MDYIIPIGEFVITVQVLSSEGLIGQGLPILAAGSRWFTVKLTYEQVLALRQFDIYPKVDA